MGLFVTIELQFNFAQIGPHFYEVSFTPQHARFLDDKMSTEIKT